MMKSRLLKDGFQMYFSMDYNMILVSEKEYHQSHIPIMQIELDSLANLGEYVVLRVSPEKSFINLNLNEEL